MQIKQRIHDFKSNLTFINYIVFTKPCSIKIYYKTKHTNEFIYLYPKKIFIHSYFAIHARQVYYTNIPT